MGAWIETRAQAMYTATLKSHPTWVRGLKLHQDAKIGYPQKSHPTWVRGLKLHFLIFRKNFNESHPTWVRGLKPFENDPEHDYIGRTLRGCVD